MTREILASILTAIDKAGLAIERELVQSVYHDRGDDEEKVPINYCAVLKAK